MQGLFNALMIAAAMQQGSPLSTSAENGPQLAPYDAKQWSDRIAPWSNPLDHDLLLRPGESKAKDLAEPYKGGVPLIYIASRDLVNPPEDLAGVASVLGVTPDGRGIMQDTLLRDSGNSVVMLEAEIGRLATCTGFHIPTPEDRAADLARYHRFKAVFPDHEYLKQRLIDRINDPNARVP